MVAPRSHRRFAITSLELPQSKRFGHHSIYLRRSFWRPTECRDKLSVHWFLPGDRHINRWRVMDWISNSGDKNNKL
ncbi:hypothetical protein Y032_0015g2805 [Ancylostoma ceylanicum]|uniref:Uncharacterized protein n=1 Tax=Ancylostoma ceylanicum TaxID=53326 RepID=A0A016V7T8_9BILA|nr:hypothetical protein Y032_0015g2805 [Ancylostoma ceylanicum]